MASLVTTTVAGTLTVNPDADSALEIVNGGTNAIVLRAKTGDELYVGSNGASAVRFPSAGGIDVTGTGTFSGQLTAQSPIVVYGGTATAASIQLYGGTGTTANDNSSILSKYSLVLNADSTNSISGRTINLRNGGTDKLVVSDTSATFTNQVQLNTSSYEGSLTFGSNATWRCGIRQHDDGHAELRIWAKNTAGKIFLATGYDGEPASIAKPTAGLVVANNNVGIGNWSSSNPSSILHIKTSANHNYEFEEVAGELRLSALNDARSANIPLQFAASEFNFVTGSVGIGTTNPSKLLHVNGDSLLGGTTTIGGNLLGAINGLFDLGTTAVKWRNLNLSGAATIADGISSPAFWFRPSSSAVHCWQPKDGYYHTTTSAHTGAIRIKLPPFHDSMVTFWVDVYDYAINESFSAYISGYPYLGSTWSYTSAVIIGGVARNFTVRFGDNNTAGTGAEYYVYIGETNSTWAYPQVVVRDVFAGYSSNEWDGDDDGWDVTFVTSFANIAQTQSNTLPYGDYNKLINTPAAGVTGTGTANYISKWTGASSQGNSSIVDNATSVYISKNTIIGRNQSMNPRLILSAAAKSSNLGKADTGMALCLDSGVSDAASSVGHLTQIGLGLINAYQPTAIGSMVSITGAYTAAHLVFATRPTTTDVAPTERMRIQDDGNVGIGTTAPGNKLQVNGSVSITDYLKHDGDADTYLLFETNKSSLYGGGLGLVVSSGNVGIGTNAPSANLHIKQGGDFTGSGGALLHIGTSVITNTSDLGLMVSVNDATTTAPQKAGLILYNNNATAGGWSPMLLFSKKESGASPYQATMAGIAAKSPLGTGNGGAWIDGELHFYTAGAATSGIVPRMVINSSGNVGIGTTAPGSYKLPQT